MGPFGTGLAAKLARNLVQYGGWLAAYEGQVLAEAAGIELSKLAQVIRASDAQIGGAVHAHVPADGGPVHRGRRPGVRGGPCRPGPTWPTRTCWPHWPSATSWACRPAAGGDDRGPVRRHLRRGRDRGGRTMSTTGHGGGGRGAAADRRRAAAGPVGPGLRDGQPGHRGGARRGRRRRRRRHGRRHRRRPHGPSTRPTGRPTSTCRVRRPPPAAGGLRGPRRRDPGHDRRRDGLAAVVHLLGPARRPGRVARLGGRPGRVLRVGDRPRQRRAARHPVPPLGPPGGDRRGRRHHPVERAPPDQPGQARARPWPPATPWCSSRHPTPRGAPPCSAGSIAEETDIPPGVVNVVPSSDHALGAILSTDPRVDQVSFTGLDGHRPQGHGRRRPRRSRRSSSSSAASRPS